MKYLPWNGALALIMISLAIPALADVKAGVDAWSQGDYPTAIKEWRPAAINGDADAQFNMGQAYKLGRGVPLDLKLAEDWYRKAAEQGHLQASDNYGLVLFQGGDRQKALPFVKASAERGEARAQYVYGTALFNGDLVAKDWVRAYAFMTRASAAGLAPASKSLAQMDGFIPIDQQQKGRTLAEELEKQSFRPVQAADATSTRPPARITPPPTPVIPPAPAIRSETLPPSQSVSTRPAVAVAGKGWRVQLGAFGDASKARALFTTLEGRISGLRGLQPYLVKAGAVTRLQAGQLGSKAAAEKLCESVKSAGQGCLAVAP